VEGGFDIFKFKIRELLKYLFSIQTGSKKIQYIYNAYSHTANAGASTTLIGTDGNSILWICYSALLVGLPFCFLEMIILRTFD